MSTCISEKIPKRRACASKSFEVYRRRKDLKETCATFQRVTFGR
jgi:hypothetical protein